MNNPRTQKKIWDEYSQAGQAKKAEMFLRLALPLSSGMDNATAYRLGRVGLALMEYPREKIGDEIDRGLVLRRLLEEAGFGIVELD